MSATPSIRLVAYPDRAGLFVFVAVPDERGRYARTDRSVVLVACPICKVIKGELCRSKQGYTSGTHAARRRAANVIKGQQDDWIEPVDPSAAEPSTPDPFPPVPDFAQLPPISIKPKYRGDLVLIEPRSIA